MEMRHPYRRIDMETWKRRHHYEVFGRGEYPYIGLTTTLDVSGFLEACREGGDKFFNAFLYVVTRAMNAVENFRYRVFEDQVVVCDVVDPSFNVMNRETELFYFAYAEYDADFRKFDAEVEWAKDKALRTNNLGGNRLDVMYVSCLPWFGFTDIIQPMGLSAGDTIPRLVWGKFGEEGGRTTMPFSITGHHGMFDGLHISQLLDGMERLMADPSFLRK